MELLENKTEKEMLKILLREDARRSALEIKGSGKELREALEEDKKMKYVIVRTRSAGVFAGYLKSRVNQEVVLVNARRIWYWEGAATLSQLAEEGTKLPQKCKFPQPVSSITLLEAIEILDCTTLAKTSIEGVPVWKK